MKIRIAIGLLIALMMLSGCGHVWYSRSLGQNDSYINHVGPTVTDNFILEMDNGEKVPFQRMSDGSYRVGGTK